MKLIRYKWILLSTFVLFSSFKPASVSENVVFCYIKSIGIKNPEIVLKQAIYESGHFKSHIFQTKNNVFGFRKTKNYLYYKNWKTCVDFYKKWQDKHYKDTTQDYYDFLQKINFCGNKKFNYALELKKIKIRGSLICNR